VKRPDSKIDYSVFYYNPERLLAILKERKKDIEVLYKEEEKKTPYGVSFEGEDISGKHSEDVKNRLIEKGIAFTAPHNSIRHLDQVMDELNDLSKRIDNWHK